MRVHLKLSGNMEETVIFRVKSFYICNCELEITFKRNHTYTINVIESLLNEVGLTIGNFYFKGLSAYEFTEDNFGKLVPLKEFPENGETSVLCMIPQNLRDVISAVTYDDNYYND